MDDADRQVMYIEADALARLHGLDRERVRTVFDQLVEVSFGIVKPITPQS